MIVLASLSVADLDFVHVGLVELLNIPLHLVMEKQEKSTNGPGSRDEFNVKDVLSNFDIGKSEVMTHDVVCFRYDFVADAEHLLLEDCLLVLMTIEPSAFVCKIIHQFLKATDQGKVIWERSFNCSPTSALSVTDLMNRPDLGIFLG
ncbi:unnamed protein product [Clavelina lepadiformis]|uniref:Uncharacterized protein n=1 Tax=Clavelina lepadiformis TaxID=159417 RepID=A0ABP0FK47_CLALP